MACSAATLLGCSASEERGGDPATGATATTGSVPVEQCAPLRSSCGRSGVDVGAAVDADALRSDDTYREAVAANFTSVTPENAMKWTVIRPQADEWDWAAADEIVDFAEQEGLDVRGHTLVWGQDAGNGLPAWLEQIEDPAELRAAVERGIREQVGRYRGRVDRWDVVNEPLDHVGAELNDNVFLERLGPGYIGDAFRAAAAADPDAELWLNDFSTEIQPDKADALVELVEQLVDDDAPPPPRRWRWPSSGRGCRAPPSSRSRRSTRRTRICSARTAGRITSLGSAPRTRCTSTSSSRRAATGPS